MNVGIIQTLTSTFEASAQQAEGGVEYWLARDLQQLLGYDEWRNFTAVISRAKTACEGSGHRGADHFVEVNKMVELGSGSQRQKEHITNNQAVRKTMLERGIRPESLSAAEDVKKIERRLLSEEKKSHKNPDGLPSKE